MTVITTASARSNVAALVDELGKLKAEISKLCAREDELKAQLVAAGTGAHDGELFRATVSKGERETIDIAAAREKLSPQWLAAHTKRSEFVVVKVNARVRNGGAAAGEFVQ